MTQMKTARQLVWECAGLVEKRAAFGDSIRGALGMETEADRARRAAMIGAGVLPFGPGGAIGGGLEGGSGGALGGAIGQAVGGGLGLGAGLLGGAGLGGLLLRKPIARAMSKDMTRGNQEHALLDAAQRAGHDAWDNATDWGFGGSGPNPSVAMDQARKAVMDQGPDSVLLDAETLDRIQELSQRGGRNLGMAGGAGLGGLGGLWGGGIYGAGEGAEYGVENW